MLNRVQEAEVQCHRGWDQWEEGGQEEPKRPRLNGRVDHLVDGIDEALRGK